MKTTKKQEKRMALLKKLQSTPEQLLSPIAKYWLKHIDEEPAELNMRYVLK